MVRPAITFVNFWFLGISIGLFHPLGNIRDQAHPTPTRTRPGCFFHKTVNQVSNICQSALSEVFMFGLVWWS
jgi:hypothetical protein